MLDKYRLKDGGIYWHKLYYAAMPSFMTNFCPPLGDYNYAFYLYNPHKYIIAIYDRTKWFIQRGRRGYADCDVWGLDNYLAGWMPGALRKLEDNKLGHPIGMTPKGWANRLRIMCEGFEAVVAMGEIPDAKTYRRLERRMRKGMKMFGKHFLDLWD